jgi:c-di-GMP-binding flagellar brake protein YcgR
VVEEFFRSVAEAFAQGRKAVLPVELALLVLVAAVVLLQLAGLVRRSWRRRTGLQQLALRHGIDASDLAFASSLARGEGIAPLALLTRVDLFERLTAQALAGAGPEPAARIHRLRRALGFDRLPAHTPLLTTRELAPGTAVELGPSHGQVVEVEEAALTVRLRGDAPLPGAGAELTLILAHAREARYELHCRLLELRPAADGRELVLAHDESPRRIQLREYSRVAARGALALHPVPPWPVDADVPVDLVARLEDVSGGGALVASRESLPVGLLAQATFALGAVRFERLPAVVVGVEHRPGGVNAVRLEWGRLGEAERSRLVAIVAHLELLGRE